MIKFFYLIQNSFKNLVRTKGIVSTFILSLLISIMAFFTFNIFLFFSHLHERMLASLENETDFIEIQMSTGPIMGFAIFKFGALLLAISLLFLTIGTIKRSHRQFLIAQKEDFKTMALIGEDFLSLSLYYTFQVFIFSLFPIVIGAILGKIIFNEAIIKTIQIGIISDNVTSFNGNFPLTTLCLFIMLAYLFITTLTKSHKQIISFIS